MWLLGHIFFYKKILHAPKAPKAQKALKALKGTKTLRQKHKTQMIEKATIFPLDIFKEHFLFLFACSVLCFLKSLNKEVSNCPNNLIYITTYSLSL